MQTGDTIIAQATPAGEGATGVIRLSGSDAISIVNGVFKGRNLETVEGHTLHFGRIYEENRLLDEVVVSIYKAPRSYTKENIVEISCHGSPYILQGVMSL
jgi:tRNA modification GTPase